MIRAGNRPGFVSAVLLGLVVAATLVCGCTIVSSEASTTHGSSAWATTITTSATTTSTATSTTTTSTSIPAFAFSVHTIDANLEAAMIRSGSWKEGDPVSLDQLRLIQLSYWGFDGEVHTGELVVNSTSTEGLGEVFGTLFEARFPFRSVSLVDYYGASDDRSMAADNTSAYNGRYVAGDPGVWSMHAYGLAIDINPVENPWVHGTAVSPVAGRAFIDRSLEHPGMIHADDLVVRAFESIGWKWGGYWSGSKDYQHFSSTGT
jgi:hypothetical protein